VFSNSAGPNANGAPGFGLAKQGMIQGAVEGAILSAEVGMAVSSLGLGGAAKQVASIAAQSSKQGADLARHLGYVEKYGAGGFKELESGRFRYYGEVNLPVGQVRWLVVVMFMSSIQLRVDHAVGMKLLIMPIKSVRFDQN
jgi:hypothetical protein